MVLSSWSLYSSESDNGNEFSEIENMYVQGKQQMANIWALGNAHFNKQEEKYELVNNGGR